MRAAGYSLDLYCDNVEPSIEGTVYDAYGHSYREFPHQYFAETGAECRRLAKDDGWKLGKRDECPKCNRARRHSDITAAVGLPG